MIIAIDGPAGAGKSTVARALAQRFGFAYVDTGAMYRAIALAASEDDLRATDETQIALLAQSLPIGLADGGQSTLLGARDVTHLIRTPQISALTSQIATLPAVREVVVEQQRRLARQGESECGGAVLEGRDIQTVVFPDAPVKIFLTADPAVRAARRLQQWQQNGDATTGRESAEADIRARDERDSTRETSPLQAAPDATIVDTAGLSSEEVVELIAQIVRDKMNE